MNVYFAAAGGLAILLGLMHSVLGELLLIRRLPRDGLPSLAPFSLVEVQKMGLVGSTDLTRRSLRLTWHLATALGLGFAAILLWLSLPSSPRAHLDFLEKAMAVSFLASSLVALFCSRGKHPAWVVLLAITILTWLGGT